MAINKNKWLQTFIWAFIALIVCLRVYFSVQLITICAVLNLKCAPEKATCVVVICAVVKYLPK